jgi:FMN-dependent NADH-azoreductase
VTLFRVDASIRATGSISRQVADSVEAAWRDANPDRPVVRRDLGAEPLPADAWFAVAAGHAGPAAAPTPRQVEGARLAARLADELIEAQAYLFAVPMYNWGVPQHVKGWIDLLLTDPRLRLTGDRPLAGRPAVLVVVRGGGYGPGTPRAGWDHATPWLLRVFDDVFGLEVRLVEAELTLAEVTPAMAGLRELAAASLSAAHESARRHGRAIAEQLRLPA